MSTNSGFELTIRSIQRTATVHEHLLSRLADSITALFQGQAMDLFWTHNGRIPLEEEYYRMVDQSEYMKSSYVSEVAGD